MITERKLRSLATGTRLRKASRLLQDQETRILRGEPVDVRNVLMVLRVLCDSGEADEIVRRRAGDGLTALDDADTTRLACVCNSVRHTVLRSLGVSPAEWDLFHRVDSGHSTRLAPIELFLEDLRSPFNVGSIFRTAECFGVRRVQVSPDCASPEHRRAERTAMGTIESVPWRAAALDDLESEPNFFALELGGTPIQEFAFPRSGVMAVGNEELGLSPALRRRADSGLGLVSIPLFGRKASLNVSVAVGIALQWWRNRLG